MTATAGTLDKVLGGAKDVLLLRDAEAEARERGDERIRLVQRLRAAARRRLNVSNLALDNESGAAGFSLMREALLLQIQAEAALDGKTIEVFALPWSEAETLIASVAQRVGVGDVPPALRALDPAQPLAAESMADHEQLAYHRTLNQLCEVLEARTRVRSTQEIRTLRVVRVGLAAAIGVSAVIALGVSIRNALRAPNLALGKPVATSALHAASKPPNSVTNGSIESDFGIVTMPTADAFVTVDLQLPQNVSEIVVYGRGDGYQAPGPEAALELSADGVTYHRIGTHPTQLQSSSAWKVTGSFPNTRFVRIMPSTPAPLQIAISEIEVRGR